MAKTWQDTLKDLHRPLTEDEKRAVKILEAWYVTECALKGLHVEVRLPKALDPKSPSRKP